MGFTNFDLTVSLFESAEKAFSLSATMPGQGTVLGRFVLPFTEQDFIEWSYGLNGNLVEYIGGSLYEAVFQDDIRFVFQDALRLATRARGNVRLRLNLDAAANRLPWELLYNRKTRQFLALDDHLSIVRQPTIPEPLLPLQVKFPLRILVVTAQSAGAELLHIDNEKSALLSSAEPLPASQIFFDWLEQPSLEHLRQILQTQEYHILHFIGHGRFLPELGEGELEFVYPSGHGQWVSATQLARILRAERTLRVVFLNACESARGSAVNPFTDVASKMIKFGDVSAALAMQYPITDLASIAFVRGFYYALLQGEPLDTAVTQGRLAIDAGVNHFEWATPVLYLHAADGQLVERAASDSLMRLEPLPPLAKLYGREADLIRYRTDLAVQNFAIIQGMAGIGKTALGTALAHEERAQGRQVYWLTFDAVSKMSGEIFVWEFASLLRQNGNASLWEYLHQESNSSARNPVAWFNLLLNGLLEGTYTICFDDIHLVLQDPVIRQLFGELQKLFRGAPEKIPARFIIMTRDVPEYMQYLQTDALTGISRTAIADWISRDGLVLSAGQMMRLERKVQGNPQFLKLAFKAGLVQVAKRADRSTQFIDELEAQRDVREYLLNAMYVQLDASEKRVLDILSVFDAFVPLSALQIVAPQEQVASVAFVVENLIRANVVQEKRANGNVGLHALVADWCYRNLDAEVKQRLHRKAAAYSEAESAFLAAAHHFRLAGEFAEAARVLNARAAVLMSSGQADALLSALNDLPRGSLGDATWLSLLRTRGEVYSRSGSEGLASDTFREAMALTRDKSVQAELLERLARSLRTRGEFAQAQETYQSALDLAVQIEYQVIVARACYGLANVLIRRGRVQEGIANAVRAVEIAENLGDVLLAAEAMFERGVGTVYVGDTHSGIQFLQNSLQVFEKYRRTDLTSVALLELGLAYHNLEEWDLAADYYARALALFELNGDIGNICSTLNNLGDLELGRGNFERALEFLARAQGMALARDDTYLQTLLYHTLAETFLGMQDFDNALAQLAEGQRLALQFDYVALEVACRRTRAEIFALQSRDDLARSEFDQVKALLDATRLEDVSEWLGFCAAYGKFLLRDGERRNDACNYLQRALEYANMLGAEQTGRALQVLLAQECKSVPLLDFGAEAKGVSNG